MLNGKQIKFFKSGDRLYGYIFVPINIIYIREEFDEENKILKCRIKSKERGIINYRFNGFLNNGALVCCKRETFREVFLSSIIPHFSQKCEFVK